MEHARSMIFDFDGTISLGNGPVLSYARHIGESLAAREATGFLDSVETALHTGRVWAEGLEEAPSDGYDAVRMLSLGLGVSDAERSAAYLASREELATSLAPVFAPEGIAQFLDEARHHVRVILATNAPDIRIAEALDSLGLAAAFDVVHTGVGKPAGLDSIVEDLLLRADGADPADALVSIGDIWTNDLAPAHRVGATTAYVGADVGANSNSTFSATSLTELYPVLTWWLTAPLAPPLNLVS